MQKPHRASVATVGRLLLTAFFGLALAATSTASEDHSGHHHHHGDHHAGELELALDDGKRWATDDSLRTGMERMLEVFGQAHDDFRLGALDKAGAAALADQVDEQVKFIFANCNLPADADAELHKLLAAAFSASATLRESDNPHDGLHELHLVLKAYGEHFDHPGWRAKPGH